MVQTLFSGWRGAWLILGSGFAGALNAVAGGGSLFSFPAMLAMGVPPIEANATNTVALWPGQFASVAAYRHDLKRHAKLLVPMGVASLAGGLLGAWLLLHTSQGAFMRIVPWLMLVASLLFAFSNTITRALAKRRVRQLAESRPDLPHQPKAVALVPLALTTLVVCTYIGYFGSGAGFLLITMLSLYGIQNLNQINALKAINTTLANGIAVVTFILSGKIVWHLCLLMMVTGALGGYLGGLYGRRIPAAKLRWVVVVAGLALAAYFFLYPS